MSNIFLYISRIVWVCNARWFLCQKTKQINLAATQGAPAASVRSSALYLVRDCSSITSSLNHYPLDWNFLKMDDRIDIDGTSIASYPDITTHWSKTSLKWITLLQPLTAPIPAGRHSKWMGGENMKIAQIAVTNNAWNNNIIPIH